MDITYRPAARNDISQMILLLQDLFTIEEDFNPDSTMQEKGLQLLLSSENAHVTVASQGHNVVGMITGQVLISTAEGGLSVLIEDLVVKSDYRGRNIGSRLLQHLYKWAETMGAKRLQLLADRDNSTGLTFYQKQRWQQTNLICLRKYTHDKRHSAHSD